MRVLFVCTGNTCRSPMAQGIFNEKYTGNGVSCKSAGLYATDGIPPTENAILACKQINVDISGYRSENIGNIDLSDFDIFAVMTEEHAEVLQLLGVPNDKIRILGGGISDPYGGDLDEYIRCRDQISKAIDDLVRDEQI